MRTRDPSDRASSAAGSAPTAAISAEVEVACDSVIVDMEAGHGVCTDDDVQVQRRRPPKFKRMSTETGEAIPVAILNHMPAAPDDELDSQYGEWSCGDAQSRDVPAIDTSDPHRVTIQDATWESRAARRADTLSSAVAHSIEAERFAIEVQAAMTIQNDQGDTNEGSLSPDDPRLHTDFRTPSVPAAMPMEPPSSVGVGVVPLPCDPPADAAQQVRSPTTDSDSPLSLSSSSEDGSLLPSLATWRSTSPALLGWVDDLSTPLRRHVETKAAEVAANFSPGANLTTASDTTVPTQMSTRPVQLSEIQITESQVVATQLPTAMATGGDEWVTEPNDAASIPPRPWMAQGPGSVDPYAGLPATPVALPSCATTPARRKPRALFGFGTSSRRADNVDEEQSSISIANANQNAEVVVVDSADVNVEASPYMPSHSAFVPLSDAARQHVGIGVADDGDPFGIPRSTLIFL